MNEKEWFECTDPTPMLEFLKGNASDRKLQLFAVACCRSVWKWLTDERSTSGVRASERYADNSGLLEELLAARGDAMRAMKDASGDSESADLGHTKWHAALAAVHCSDMPFHWHSGRDASIEARQAESCFLFESNPVNQGIEIPFPWPEPIVGAAHADLLRDIFANPFHAITMDPSWLSSTVIDLATTIYSDRVFERLPILADALMDAGCDSDDILNHCRSEGPHVRGCWVVDLLLGKE